MNRNAMFPLTGFLKKSMIMAETERGCSAMSHKQANEEDALIAALPLLYRLVMSSAGLKPTGLTKTQVIILSSLALQGPLRMSQIADYISSSKTQATRAVAALEEEGYITRYIDTENRTQVYVRLTETGEDFLSRWKDESRANLRRKLDERVPSKEQERLYQAASEIIEILGKLK